MNISYKQTIKIQNSTMFCCHHTLVWKHVFVILLWYVVFSNGNNLIGCYEKDDSLQKINRVHEIKISYCIDACIEEKKLYAALETQICYCTNVKNNSHIVEDARCFPCSLNQNEICGGFGVVALYETGVKGK